MINSPQEVYNILDEKICSQDRAKKVLSNEIFKHVIRFCYNLSDNNEEEITAKSSTLLMGPTGCGKTYLIDVLREEVFFPVFSIDATLLTNTGYKGNSIEDYFKEFYSSINLNSEYQQFSKKTIMEYSIIFIDEIDKVCAPHSSSSIQEWHRNLQYNLLSILQGTDIYVGARTRISTKNMLFIFGGNFKELRKTREAKQKPSVGFVNNAPKIPPLHQQLIEAGIIDELAGRISVVAELEALSKKELKTILYNKKGSVYENYLKLFDYIGYDVSLSRYYIDKIVDKAYNNGTGVRGIQAELDKVLENDIFNMWWE